MEWMLIFSIIIFIIGMICLFIGNKYIKLTEEEIKQKRHKEIQESLQDAEKSLEIAQQRAEDATKTAEQIKILEEQKLDKELQHKREIGELSIESSFNIKTQKLQQKYETFYNECQNKISNITQELDEKQQILDEYKNKCSAITEAILRKREIEEQEEFYSIQLSQNDKEDISILQQMDLKLHNRNVLPKLIWDLFIRRPTDELIKRETGGRSISGIYKITNKQTGESYIGRTTDIATRWKNHIKTAIGLDALASSTLHTRLATDGIWNYTFEIIEEVPKEKLSEREIFYINLYDTKKQLNMKNGDKNGA